MRVDQLTFTRFLAAIAIVIFHYGHETVLFTNSFLEKIFSQANVGVSYFFVLSGFVMIIAYRNREVSIGEFYRNRVARIYPLYFFAIIFLATLVKYNGGNFYFGELLISISGLQSWVPNYPLSLNSPGWSISVEFFFYALFPFIAKFIYNRQLRKPVLYFILIVWVLTQLVFNYFLEYNPDSVFVTSDLVYYFPLMHLNQFLIGMATGIYFIDNKNAITFKNWSLLIVSLLFLLIWLLIFPISLDYHNGLLAVVFAPLIFALSMDSGRISKFISRKPFVFLGEISFGIYILQLPVYQLYVLFCKAIKMDFNFWGYLFFLILFSGITYLFIEKPLRNYISKVKLT